MKSVLRHITAVVSVPTFVFSCDYREIPDCIEGECRMWVAVDWTKFTQETPTGMSVYCYRRDGLRGPYVYRTNNTRGVMVYLPKGEYDILAFNQGIDEFGSMRFKGMDSFSTASAVLEEMTGGSRLKSGADTVIRYEPEWLGSDTVEGIEITSGMVEKRSSDTVTLATLTPRNLVYSANVTIRIYGINNLIGANGTVSGMSEGVSLTRRTMSASTVTHSLEDWGIVYDEDDPTCGYIHTTYNCFGMPRDTAEGMKASPESAIFKISLLLRDLETVCEYTYKVGDRIKCSEKEMTLDLNIGRDGYLPQPPTEDGDPDRPLILPEVKPVGGGGFKPKVDLWDEKTEILIF